ncbi:MAG: efflux transporter outer membrane subunit [Opitutaceae bacterium]|nr:efflux transporter outer membrane subunit [Opitutaceae bacterium]
MKQTFKRMKQTGVLLTSLSILSGCITHPVENQNEAIKDLIPQTWTTTSETQTTSNHWLEDFNDSTLIELVHEVEENNFGLEAAKQQVKAVEAVSRISRSLRYPTLGVNLSSGKQQSRIPSFNFQKIETESHSLTLSSQWEIDLWNRLGNAHAASLAQYEASLLDYEALRLSLAGQVAKGWFNILEATAQFQLAQDTASSFDANRNTLEKRYQRGLISGFELRLIRAQAASSRAEQERYRIQLDQTKRQFEVLLGRYPSSQLQTEGDFPRLEKNAPVGLPSDLLARRPDIMAEERRLAAVVAQDKSIQRNWLPRIALTANGGTASNQLSDLLDSDFSIWSIFGDLSAPLFQGGRLKAERDQSDALRLAQIAQYKNTVLIAFQEVETTLAAETALKRFEKEITVAAIENNKAEKQSWKLYERGLINITSVLDSQRRAFDTQRQLISIKNLRLQNRINLYLALGGGFLTAS